MTKIIRNKLVIIPNKALSKAEIKAKINEVADYCKGEERGFKKEMSFSKISPKPNNLVKDSKEEDDWYLYHWGTREIAYNVCWVSDNAMIFDTLYNPACPIACKIMKHFPDVNFSFLYASDKTGRTTGELKQMDGKIYAIIPRDYCKRAYDIAFDLRPHKRALYTLNSETGTYDYDMSDILHEVGMNGYYQESDGTMLIGLDDKGNLMYDPSDDLPF